jgi:phage tail sheath protein FI
VNYTYPGVYISEQPASAHAIIGVATSITAFVGYAARGLQNTAVELFSWQDFVRSFGGLTADSELSYVVQQFFSNGGGTCFVVRIPKDDAVAGKLVIGDAASPPNQALTLEAISSGSWSRNLIVETDLDGLVPVAIPLAGTVTLASSKTLAATSPAAVTGGQWVVFAADSLSTPYRIASVGAANITLEAEYAGATPAAPSGWSLLPGYDSTAFNLTLTDTISGVAEVFSNVSMNTSATRFVQTIVNDPDNGSRLVRVSSASAAAPQITGFVASLPGDAGLSIKPGPSGLDAWLKAQAGGPSSGAAAFVLTPSFGGVAQTPVAVTLWKNGAALPNSLASLLRLFATATTRALQANHAGAQVTAGFASVAPGAAATALRISVTIPNNDDVVLSFSEPSPAPAAGQIDIVALLGLGAASNPVSNVGAYYFAHAAAPAAAQLAGGLAPADGVTPPTATDIVGSPAAPGPGGSIVQTGIYALDKVDLFNILCLPDATRAASGQPTTPYYSDTDINAIYSAAMDYCAERRAFLLIDTPPDVVDVGGAINWRSSRLTVGGANGAVYFPRAQLADPLNRNALRSFAPSGVISGVYASEDSNRGVWKAPAGIETQLSGVQKLTYNLTDAEQGALNPIALNCLRNFPIYGPVVWGARTLAGADAMASQWKYVPVRRFALFLEESLYRGLKWAVFEPNAEPLWAQIRLTVTSFMQNLFLQNAFQGQTPSTAYFVQCDSSTTTQQDIDSGVVNVVVGFAPLEPAEFVVLKLQQMAGQVAV